MAASLVGCSSEHTVTGALPPTSPDDAVRRLGDSVEIDTARVPAWSVPSTQPVAVVFLQARVIVIRREPNAFSVLSAECPHAGCGVSVVERARLLCPCHGSAFTYDGVRLEGPATTGLRPLVSSWVPDTGRLRITLS